MTQDKINEFISQCEPYLQGGELMSNQPFEPLDGNAISYTCEMHLISRRFFPVANSQRAWVYSIYKSSQALPGVITRGPHKQFDVQKHDDYVWLTAASFFFDRSIAYDVLNWGMENWWTYNNTKSKAWKVRFNSWFWRLPGVIQHFQLCADQPLSWFGRFWYAVDFFWTATRKRDDTSGRRMDWAKREVYLSKENRHRYWIVDRAIQFWEWRVKKHYPRMYGDINQVYFGRDPNLMKKRQHPFVIWMLDKL